MALPIQLPRDINFQPYNVLRFGADPTGQTDSRLAFKAAVFFAVTGYPLPKSLVTGSDMYDFPKFTAGPNKGNPIIPCFPDVLYPNLVYSTARLENDVYVPGDPTNYPLGYKLAFVTNHPDGGHAIGNIIYVPPGTYTITHRDGIFDLINGTTNYDMYLDVEPFIMGNINIPVFRRNGATCSIEGSGIEVTRIVFLTQPNAARGTADGFDDDNFSYVSDTGFNPLLYPSTPALPGSEWEYPGAGDVKSLPYSSYPHKSGSTLQNYEKPDLEINACPTLFHYFLDELCLDGSNNSNLHSYGGKQSNAGISGISMYNYSYNCWQDILTQIPTGTTCQELDLQAHEGVALYRIDINKPPQSNLMFAKQNGIAIRISGVCSGRFENLEISNFHIGTLLYNGNGKSRKPLIDVHDDPIHTYPANLQYEKSCYTETNRFINVSYWANRYAIRFQAKYAIFNPDYFPGTNRNLYPIPGNSGGTIPIVQTSFHGTEFTDIKINIPAGFDHGNGCYGFDLHDGYQIDADTSDSNLCRWYNGTLRALIWSSANARFDSSAAQLPGFGNFKRAPGGLDSYIDSLNYPIPNDVNGRFKYVGWSPDDSSVSSPTLIWGTETLNSFAKLVHIGNINKVTGLIGNITIETSGDVYSFINKLLFEGLGTFDMSGVINHVGSNGFLMQPKYNWNTYHLYNPSSIPNPPLVPNPPSGTPTYSYYGGTTAKGGVTIEMTDPFLQQGAVIDIMVLGLSALEDINAEGQSDFTINEFATSMVTGNYRTPAQLKGIPFNTDLNTGFSAVATYNQTYSKLDTGYLYRISGDHVDSYGINTYNYLISWESGFPDRVFDKMRTRHDIQGLYLGTVNWTQASDSGPNPVHNSYNTIEDTQFNFLIANTGRQIRTLFPGFTVSQFQMPYYKLPLYRDEYPTSGTYTNYDYDGDVVYYELLIFQLGDPHDSLIGDVYIRFESSSSNYVNSTWHWRINKAWDQFTSELQSRNFQANDDPSKHIYSRLMMDTKSTSPHARIGLQITNSYSEYITVNVLFVGHLHSMHNGINNNTSINNYDPKIKLDGTRLP